jgi:putative transcriptional regulator
LGASAGYDRRRGNGRGDERSRRAAHDARAAPCRPTGAAHKTLRRALALKQEEFAARYHIPLGTLRDWEQGRCQPDQPARAYLAVIASDPKGVQRALAGKRL